MPGILFGNPKVHEIPIFLNTPTHLLDKQLKPIWSPLTTNEVTVKNYFDFAEEVVWIAFMLTKIPLEVTR